MKIVVIIPTYNEKENIEKMLPHLEGEIFPKVKGHNLSILVADDKSPDGTADVVRESMKKWDNIELIIGEKEGLGAAYVRAMHYAMDEMKADAIIEFDADFQHDSRGIISLIETMDKGYDYVIASRYIKGGEIPKEWGIHRKFISYFGGLFARVVLLHFNIHDMTSGFKLTKTDYLRKIDLDHLYSKYYAYKIHILHDLLLKGAKTTEVPTIFYERVRGSSKIEQKDLFDSFYVVVRLRLRDSKKFIKFLMVGGFGFILNAVILRLLVDGVGWHPAPANLVGAAAAIFSNYNFNNLWTFKESRAKTVWQYFFKMLQFYLTSSTGVILIQTGTIFVGTHFVGQEYYFQFFILGTFFLLIWNFTLYNKVIWRKK